VLTQIDSNKFQHKCFPIPFRKKRMSTLSQHLSNLLPGRYRRDNNSNNTTNSSSWSEGELFSISPSRSLGVQNIRFRFLTKANAFWSFTIIFEDEDENENFTLSSFQNKDHKFKGEILESPGREEEEEEDHNINEEEPVKETRICIVEITASSSSIITLKLEEDFGQLSFTRFLAWQRSSLTRNTFSSFRNRVLHASSASVPLARLDFVF
jgi:hypothetical protein